jgi:hypothetical protein
MSTCIYCKRNGENVKFNKEHVVPSAFVKGVINAPTLIGCVCEECNNYFGKELDSPLARDSIEGIQRYKSGIKSSETRRPHGRVQMKWAMEEKTKHVDELNFQMNGETGKVEPQRMYLLIDKRTKKQISITRENVTHFDINPWLRRKLSIQVVGPKADMRYISNRLRKRGLKLKSAETLNSFTEVLPKSGQVLIEMTGIIDALTKRVMAKIILNYLAFHFGSEFVLKMEFDSTREFIRTGRGSIVFRVKTGVFWDYETENFKMILPLGTSIKIENSANGLIGFIQMFDMAIYEILLGKIALPEAALIGHRFVAGHPPLLHKPFKFNFTFYIPEYTANRLDRISIKHRKYGP